MQTATTRRWIWILPNVLSTARLALAILFPFVPDAWRLTVVAAGAVSDWLDGFIARRFAAMSVAGGLLDGISDKLFTLSVVVTLAVEAKVAWWQALLVLARDLAVAGVTLYGVCIRDWAAFTRMVPRLPGKVTTVLFFVWFVAEFASWAAPARTPLYVLATAASLVAATDYLARFARELRARRRQADRPERKSL